MQGVPYVMFVDANLLDNLCAQPLEALVLEAKSMLPQLHIHDSLLLHVAIMMLGCITPVLPGIPAVG